MENISLGHEIYSNSIYNLAQVKYRCIIYINVKVCTIGRSERSLQVFLKFDCDNSSRSDIKNCFVVIFLLTTFITFINQIFRRKSTSRQKLNLKIPTLSVTNQLSIWLLINYSLKVILIRIIFTLKPNVASAVFVWRLFLPLRGDIFLTFWQLSYRLDKIDGK